MFEIHGKTTINPWLFYSGKFAGYFVWAMGLLALSGAEAIHQQGGKGWDLAAVAMLIPGIFLIVISSVALGRSIRVGLPEKNTVLQTGGIYRFSRNPMYLGVHLVTLAAMAYTLKWWIITPGLFSFLIYHLIIIGEEAFLEKRFKEAYRNYRQITGRYL